MHMEGPSYRLLVVLKDDVKLQAANPRQLKFVYKRSPSLKPGGFSAAAAVF